MIKYKLKKEVKQILAFSILTIIAIVGFAYVIKNSNNAYEECLIKNNNDVNYCFRLIQG